MDKLVPHVLLTFLSLYHLGPEILIKQTFQNRGNNGIGVTGYLIGGKKSWIIALTLHGKNTTGVLKNLSKIWNYVNSRKGVE